MPASSNQDTPKMTFGGYQRDFVGPEQQYFYQPGLHNITAHRITSDTRWEVTLNDFTVNGTHIRPSVRHATLDSGTGMMLLHYPDWVKIINEICDGVKQEFNDSLNTSKPIQCKHTGQAFVQITNCDIGVVRRMPKMEIQIDSITY